MGTTGAPTEERLETAADWWAKFQEAEPSPEEVSAWLGWMEEDARNAESFKQVNELAQRVRWTQAAAPERLSPLRPSSSPLSLRERAGVRVLRPLALAALDSRGRRHNLGDRRETCCRARCRRTRYLRHRCSHPARNHFARRLAYYPRWRFGN